MLAELLSFPLTEKRCAELREEKEGVITVFLEKGQNPAFFLSLAPHFPLSLWGSIPTFRELLPALTPMEVAQEAGRIWERACNARAVPLAFKDTLWRSH